ncbi:MAG: LCP family protein [Acidimicrobiales bacterium]
MTMPSPELSPSGPPLLPQHGRSWGQRFVIAFGAVLAVLALLGALVVGIVWWRFGSFDRINLDLAPNTTDDKPLNFLVVGSDSRENISEDDPDAGAFLGEEVGGKRTDTIIVMRVDPAAKQIHLLSVPRDLWVPLNGTGPNDRVNTAFAEGGAQELINTVQAALRIDINHYVEVDFKGFKSLVDTVGGIPLYFDRAMYDDNSGLNIPDAGCYTLDGSQALAFARSRHLVYYNEDSGEYEEDLTADLGRITRQQLFLRRVMDKVAALGLTDVTKLNRLVGVATDNVTFDDGLGTAELVDLARQFSSLGSEAMTTHALPTDLTETPEGASVVVLREAEAQPTLDIFRGRSTVTTTSAVPTLSPSQVAVSVLNGTGVTGQAGEAAAALEAIGFPVAQVGDAGVGETRTTLRYAPASSAAAELVASYLQPGVNLLEDATVGRGVVLVTGADWVGITVPEVVEDPAATGATTTTVVGVTPPGVPPPGITCG